MTVYVLDTFALLAFLWQEAGYQKVSKVFHETVDNHAMVHMSRINLGEAF